MNILIIEDEALYADQLQMVVESLNHTVCGLINNAEEALRLLETTNPDMALVDINLAGEMNGLELGKWIKRFKEIPIIYVTSFQATEYFNQAKALSAFAFLEKPIDKERLARTIELGLQFYQQKQETPSDKKPIDKLPELVIKIKAKYIKINQKDIAYIEAEDKYCNIYLDDGTVYVERTSLKDINNKLTPELFAQTHRSYIVNLDKVRETDTADFTISVNQKHIPLGNTYKDYFLKKFGVS